VLSMDVVGHHAGIIGDPKPLDPSQAVTAAPAAQVLTSMPPQAVGPGPAYGANTPSPHYAQPGQGGMPQSTAYSGYPSNSFSTYQNPGPTYGAPYGGQQSNGGQNMGMNSTNLDSRMPQPGMTAAPGNGRPVPPPHYGAGSGAVARNEAPAKIMTIKSLNPFSGRWTIKAKCTSKAELKR
jgi:replication factor A1